MSYFSEESGPNSLGLPIDQSQVSCVYIYDRITSSKTIEAENAVHIVCGTSGGKLLSVCVAGEREERSGYMEGQLGSVENSCVIITNM